jgi:nucleotide-binding universal stress UspA family protein
MKLLAALDFSPAMPAILHEARIWAQRLNAKLWLIHIAEPDPDFIGYKAGPDTVRDSMAGKFHREHQQIETAAQELRKAGVEATALLLQGPTAETILKEADRLDVDAILMGTHARGAVRELLIGSVSKQVLHQSTRPILLIPPHATARPE